MNGSSSVPIKAVNNSITATLLSLKNRSTRYLSKWTEIAHSTGPEKAKTTQDTFNACSKKRSRTRRPFRGNWNLGSAGELARRRETQDYSHLSRFACPGDAAVEPKGGRNFAFLVNTV